MNILNLLIPSTLLLASCGGSGSSTPPPAGTSPPPPPPVVQTPPGGVELGPIEGATVTIQALDKYTLATTTTDSKGLFTINVEELKAAVSRYGSEIKFVEITSTGGTDIDPDDDGVIVESEKIKVEGTVTGIVPLKTLYEAKHYRINFISTALVDILNSETDVSDSQINYILTRLGVPDLTEDGKIDIDDLTAYNIKNDTSEAEVILRDGFLEYIHNGDEEAQKLFIEELKYQVGFTRPLITKNSSDYSVKLSKTDLNNTIYYGVVVDQKRPTFLEYSGEELRFNNDTAIFYQECSEDFGCYRLQKLFFYNNTYYSDFDFELIDDDYQKLQTVLNDLKEARVKYTQANGDHNETLKKIRELEEKIRLLKLRINSL